MEGEWVTYINNHYGIGVPARQIKADCGCDYRVHELLPGMVNRVALCVIDGSAAGRKCHFPSDRMECIIEAARCLRK